MFLAFLVIFFSFSGIFGDFFHVICIIMKLLLPLTDIRLRISWPYKSRTKESPLLKNE